MEHPAFGKLLSQASAPTALEMTVSYLESHLRRFIRQRERVLICFPRQDTAKLGGILEQAVLRAGGIPMFWEQDLRWKTLLKLAFASKASALIAPPLIALGLAKLAKAARTPLYIRNVLVAGYPCLDWMADGIQWGLDCKVWGCYDPGAGAVIGGFSCGKSRGVHLRTDVYGVSVVDASGNAAADGQAGEVVLYSLDDPSCRCATGEYARLEAAQCICGSRTPRLMEISAGPDVDSELLSLMEYLLRWTSVLDCCLSRGPYGLEMEIVTFPGEKLPKFPTCARQVVRAWDAERDAPMQIMPGWKNTGFSGESH